MIWNEMLYNRFFSNELEIEPEELFEYFKNNSKKKEEDFDEFEQTSTFILN